jgi:hypothetical protein
VVRTLEAPIVASSLRTDARYPTELTDEERLIGFVDAATPDPDATQPSDSEIHVVALSLRPGLFAVKVEDGYELCSADARPVYRRASSLAELRRRFGL